VTPQPGDKETKIIELGAHLLKNRAPVPPPTPETWKPDPEAPGNLKCEGCGADWIKGTPTDLRDYHKCPPPPAAEGPPAEIGTHPRGKVSAYMDLVKEKNQARAAQRVEAPFVRPIGALAPKERLRKLKILSARVGKGFECKAACGKCCETPVDMARVEWDDMMTRAEVRAIVEEHDKAGRKLFVVPRTDTSVQVGLDSGVCPFLHPETKQCRVYNMRPFTCRAYGQHWMMLCKEGVDPKPGLKSAGGQEVSDEDMHTWGDLVAHPTGLIDLDKWEHMHGLTSIWRKEDPALEAERRDRMPTFDDLKRIMRAQEAATPTPEQPKAE
jgi:Fe-S-cluster containining protein